MAPLPMSRQHPSTMLNELDRRLLALIESLESHPNMDHDNPTNTHPKSLYYTWDFVQRTRHELSQISRANLDAGETQAKERFVEVVGRCKMVRMLVTDRSGDMVRKVTGGQAGVDFGPVARARAEVLRIVGDD
ncbi:MAG: hypothetical protein MMC23_003678 [Stictis urceolatum]|nr:hypothetical protein [Stictis urceolata]